MPNMKGLIGGIFDLLFFGLAIVTAFRGAAVGGDLE